MTDDNRPAPTTTDPSGDDLAPTRAATELGLQLRFDGGRPVLSLEGKRIDGGGEVRRALFDVPTSNQPVNVGAGAIAWQHHALTLRAVELVVPFDLGAASQALRASGISLLRERARAGGVDLLLLVDGDGADAGAPVRARVSFAPAADGLVLVVDELIGLPSLPRPRLALAASILAALAVPGATATTALVRRAAPIATLVGRLLRQHAWAKPGMGDLRVRDIALARGELVVRGWSGTLPEGWRAPREPRRAVVEELTALQSFADGIAGVGDDRAQRSHAEVLAARGDLAPAVVPYVVDLLRDAGASTAAQDALVQASLKDDGEHLALLGVAAELDGLAPAERSARLRRVAAAADAADDPWVAARAAMAAAQQAERAGLLDAAVDAAGAAVDADPTLAEAGRLLARLLAKGGDRDRALEVGRAALDRAGQGSIVDSAADLEAACAFAVELAAVARDVEGADAARALLTRALRAGDRSDALMALAVLEAEAGRADAAADVVGRLQHLASTTPALVLDVALLSARLAEVGGDTAAARAHLEAAHARAPDDARVATQLARLRNDAGEHDAAVAVLTSVVDRWLTADATVVDDELRRAAQLSAHLLVERAHRQPPPTSANDDAVRARRVVARILAASPGDTAATRVDAEARAVLGDGKALAALLLADAAAASDGSGAARRARAARLLAAAGDGVAAFDAWQAAWDEPGQQAARDVVDVTSWLAVARSIADPRRLGALLSRTGVQGLDLSAIVTSFLRATVGAVDDVGARRGVLGVIAARNADIADVERWLDACRAQQPADAAEAFLHAARAHRRADWLLEATKRLDEAGAHERSLRVLLDGIAGDESLAGHPGVLARAFDLAVELDDADAIDARADALVAATDEADARRAVFARRFEAHDRAAANPARSHRAVVALRAWATSFPTDRTALDGLVGRLLEDGDVADAVAVLDRACAAGIGAGAHVLLSRAAAAARHDGGPTELRVNELLLGMDLEPDARDRIERVLVDAYVREGRPARAVALLSTMASRPEGAADARSSLWLRAATMHETAGDLAQVIDALEHAVQLAPDDAAVSERLRSTCVAARDDHALARECLRRAARLGPSEERNALFVVAGDVARSAARHEDARLLWLRAARRPFGADAHARLQALALETGSDRLAVRAHLAAAQALADVDVAAAVGHAAAAAARLAGALKRPRLSVAALEFCERSCAEAGLDGDEHARALIALSCALGDGAAARRRLDVLVERATGTARARLLEQRAGVLLELLRNEDGAIADWRAALWFDPAATTAARALAARLRARGELRGAIDVERAHIDAALTGEERGRAIAALAATAEHELGDDGAGVVDDLCTSSLALIDDLDVRRRQVAARQRLGDAARTAEALMALLRHRLPIDERAALAERLATLHEGNGQPGDAADALLVLEGDPAYAEVPGRTELVARIVALLQACGRTVEAADVLLRALARWPEGAAPLGSRHEIQHKAALWLDDGGAARGADALALFAQLAAAAPLNDDDEKRRARLAEAHERPDIAIAALENLIARDVDTAACAVRLAAAAEAWGEPDRALRAWQLRVERVVDDNDAWTAIERLAAANGDQQLVRRAREVLFERAVGAPVDRAARAVACARDARDRTSDLATALVWLARARALAPTAALRLEALSVAAAAGDDKAECALLDEMVAAGDQLAPGARLRRATLRLALEESAAAAQVALGDVLALVDHDGNDGGDKADPGDALALIAARAPAALAAAVVLRRSTVLQTALSASLATIDTAAIGDDVVFALADAFSGDAAIVRLAAARDAANGAPTRAADRLLRLATTAKGAPPETTRALVDAAAAHAIAAGGGEFIARLDGIKPALRRHLKLRDDAIAVLRSLQAFDEIVTVLDDAIVVVDDRVERRTLRLQLVEVLREYKGAARAAERAAPHLQALIDDDSSDRDAWDALLSLLEAQGDTETLQRALARRASLVEGDERARLVRRRVECLLAAGRGVEGLADLRAVRATDHDPALKDLEQRIHAAIDAADPDPAFARGGPAVARFLDDELTRSPSVDDARVLLALPPGAAVPGARVRAQLALVTLLDDGDDARARSILAPGTGASVEDRADDAAALLEAASRHGDARIRARAAGLARALIEHAGLLGSRDAARFADALRSLDVDLPALVGNDAAHKLAAATVARRWRLRGPRTVVDDIGRLPALARAALAFRRASRLADRALLEDAALELGNNVVDAVAVAPSARARAELDLRAQQALLTVAAGPGGDLALLRQGDRRGVGRVVSRPESVRHRIARRAARVPLTLPRLDPRLALADHLAPPDDDVALELRSIAAAAARFRQLAIEARALDQMFATQKPSAADLVRRADVAVAAGAPDAVDWCERAADAATVVPALDDDATRLRRAVIDARLRAGDTDALAAQLRAFARSAQPGPAGNGRRDEAISIAEAARLLDVVDAIIADAAAASSSSDDRVAALRRRARLRLNARQPAQAVAVFVHGARDNPDLAAVLRDEAYAIACEHALIDAMVEVVDDDLARAGLLAVIGRRREALALAETLDTPAALWLRAECARRADDADAEEAALAALAARGLADEALIGRLIEAAGERGDHDAAARRALGLVSGVAVDAARVQTAVFVLKVASPAARIEGLHELVSLAVTGLDRGLDVASVEALFAGALAVADDLAASGFADERRQTRFAYARHKDTDAAWADVLHAELDADTERLAEALSTMWDRPSVLHALVARVDSPAQARNLAGVVRLAVAAGNGDLVADALSRAPRLPWPVADAVASTLELGGKPRDAALVLSRSLSSSSESVDVRRALRLRACALLLRADAGGAAARLLQEAARDELDEATLRQVSDVIVAAARGGAMGDAALLAAHVARLTGEDRFAVRAIGMADAAGGDVALHVGRWRLRERDVRALPLLAHHCLEQSPAQGFFGAWHALRSGVREFVNHAPDGFATIALLRNGAAQSSTQPAALPHERSLLQRARVNRRPHRAEAWLSLAAEVAAVDVVGCTRLVARAGVPVRNAPLEVRLALDPELKPPAARAAAIVAGLADIPVTRRRRVVDDFDALSARGATSATQRRAVDALAARARPFVEVAIDAAAVGDTVDVAALVRSLGRRPAASTRTATAALLASLGHEALARSVAPSVASPEPATTARAGRQRPPEDSTDDIVRLGRLLLAQLGGPRIDVEEEICALAEKHGRTWIVAQSLHRLASIAPTADERAQHLRRRAELLRARRPEAAWRSAAAAHRLFPDERSARLLAELADGSGDPRRTEQALGAWASCASAAEDIVDATLRQARIVADALGETARAITLLDDAAARAPRVALFRERAALARERLGDEHGAAAVLVDGASRAVDIDDVTRRAWLREGATVLAAAQDGAAAERAVLAFCAAHEGGDSDALAAAEELARRRTLSGGLARVLDLRLRDTEDVATRRELVLERARLLHDLDDKMGALALLEAQAVADEVDVGARLTLARWYLADRRVLDAALAFESAARIPGLPPAAAGPAAREAAVLFAAIGDLDRAGPLADLSVTAGVGDLQVVTVAEAWHRSRENWIAVDELLGRQLAFLDDPRREAHVWMERALVRRERTNDDAGARKALARVLELVPDHPRALQMARDDARRSDTWGVLRAALLRASETAREVRVRAALLREIAGIDADQLDDVRAALALLDRALDIAPDDIDALSLKAILMVRAGHVDGVVGLMERIEQAGGDNSKLPGQLHLVRGDALNVAGDVDNARLAFLRATEDPESATKGWDRLIDMAWGSADALPLLEEARRSTIDVKRKQALSRKELRLRSKLGDDEGAFDVARAILDREPGDTEAIDVVRPVLLRDGRKDELAQRLVAWAKAIDAQASPLERGGRLAVAGAFLLVERSDETSSRALLDEALALYPDEPVALLHLADIAWASRDDERGLQLLDRLTPEAWVQAKDEHGAPRELPDLYYRRARCAYALGNDDVRERLRLVLRQDARHVRALEMLSRVAAEHGDDDNSEFALEALSGAISRRDDAERLVNVFTDLAQLRLRRGKHDEAVSAAESAFSLAPDSLPVLEVLADAREEAGRKADVADTWFRIAALKAGGERRKALERRARALVEASRFADAASAWMDLYAESNDPRHRSEADALAPHIGRERGAAGSVASTTADAATTTTATDAFDPDDVGERTESMARAPGPAGDALEIQLRANIDAGDFERALKLALDAGVATLDDDCARLALVAAERSRRFDAYVDIVEARLPLLREVVTIKEFSLGGGRVARDMLRDNERAAGLLYQAHQADAEDVDVRLELTAVYARIPRLASPAVTGVVQLLRRVPDDPRVFALAAFLAEQQAQPDRATAMRGIASLLTGQAVAPETAVRADAPTNAITPLDRDGIAGRIGPTGWGSPLQQVLAIVAPHLELTHGRPVDLPGAKPLAQASPRSLALAERADRLLPGRVAQLVVADVERSFVVPAAVPVVVLPRDLLAHEAALLASIARGLAVIRWHAAIVDDGLGTEELVRVLRAALLHGGAGDERATSLAARLGADEKESAQALLVRALEAPEVPDVAGILTRACDRFALMATGAPLAALTAGPLPSLVRASPARQAELLRQSARGLDLTAFAARDNVWLLRRAHGL